MKIAVISDIHSNLAALEAVLADVDNEQHAAEVWCLGDIVGYGPDPHACIELVQKRCSACVAGNHDRAATRKLACTAVNFNEDAAEAARWTAQQLDHQENTYLETLPLVLEMGNFTLVHGSPRDPVWEYVLSEHTAAANLACFDTLYCLIGHSHSPLIFECDDACSALPFREKQAFRLEKKRLLINPGGVGQPRDGDPRASYAVFDSEAATVTLLRVEYDIGATQQKMRKAGLPEWLSERLESGR